MPESFALKPISKAAIPRALEKAERYRLLDEPEEAESICLDILEADAENQAALVVLILAVTDQFETTNPPPERVALAYLERLIDPYQRRYYEGIIHEREARARLRRSMGASFAYDGFRQAMACYEKAMTLNPDGDDEAILRWNACVRTIQRAGLAPRPVEPEQQLE